MTHSEMPRENDLNPIARARERGGRKGEERRGKRDLVRLDVARIRVASHPVVKSLHSEPRGFANQFPQLVLLQCV